MNISDKLKLRHLEVFVEVARRKSITLAAEALSMAQPGVSRAIRELEALCGKTLVEKQGRGIRISAYGMIFLDYAGRSLALARDGVAALNALDADYGPPINIGALPTVSATIVPQAVAQFRAAGLMGQLRISTGENTYLLDQLRRGALDLVIGRLPAPENMLGLSFDPLYKERVIAVVASTHPLATQSSISSADLQTYPMLIPSKESIIRPSVDRLFLEQGFAIPFDAIETVSDSFGKSFTQDHRAIWFISKGVVRAELDQGRFRALAIDTEMTRGAVGLCTRREYVLSAAMARFCEALQEIASRIKD